MITKCGHLSCRGDCDKCEAIRCAERAYDYGVKTERERCLALFGKIIGAENQTEDREFYFLKAVKSGEKP